MARPTVKFEKKSNPGDTTEAAISVSNETLSQQEQEIVVQPSFTFLKTAVAPVRYLHAQSSAKILLDEGAQRTLVTKSQKTTDTSVHARETQVIRLSVW